MDLELQAAVRTLAVAGRGLERAAEQLTLSQYRILLLVASSPERAGRLAERALVSRPSLTGVLDALEAKGCIHREDVAGDRRGVQLHVTDEGRRLLGSAETAMTEWLEGLLLEAPAADRDRVLRGLGALEGALSRRREAGRAAVAQGPR